MPKTEGVVVLPALLGTRLQAREALGDVPRAGIVLDASLVRAASPSFADEVVRLGLQEQTNAEITVLSTPPFMAERLRRAAILRGVSDRLVLE